jgi:hypothetical protein
MRGKPGLVTETGVDPVKMLRLLVSTRPGLLFRLVKALVKG